MQRWYPYIEMAFWLGGLLWLAFSPMGHDHITICPIGAMGFDWCPGCGLGHAIHALFQGHWQASWQHHPFAVPAVLILLHRIYSLFIQTQSQYHVRKTKRFTAQS